MLERLFPGLARGNYQITSPRDRRYNCIGWAMGDVDNWWWPGVDLIEEFWPPEIPREVTQEAFEAAFLTQGYSRCDTGDLEDGCEKVALYANAQGVPTHAARQLSSGQWTSKLGRMEDIEHALDDLVGALYGSVIWFMKRSTPGDQDSARGSAHG